MDNLDCRSINCTFSLNAFRVFASRLRSAEIKSGSIDSQLDVPSVRRDKSHKSLALERASLIAISRTIRLSGAIDANQYQRQSTIDIPLFSESIMVSSGSKRVLVTIPIAVKEWLQARAIYNGGTQSAEIVRSVRERIERETCVSTRTPSSNGVSAKVSRAQRALRLSRAQGNPCAEGRTPNEGPLPYR
jgi:hypothetical protein